jgi:predicted metal-dependent hydrolase
MRLRIKDDVRLKLTYPAGLSKAKAISWAVGQSEWIERQLAALPPAEPFAPGAIIPLEGHDTKLMWLEKAPRAPRLESGALIAGGPGSSFSARIERYLKRRAVELLSQETAEFSAALGVAPKSVSVGDASTRWGSCSSTRRIRYSWRLVLAPAEARRYVVAHEVAHLKELNHGPEFKRIERELYGEDVGAAKALLRNIGPRLRRLGLGG